MSRLRPFRTRVGVAGAASLAALSMLATSLTPLAMRASAAEEGVQSPEASSAQDAATVSANAEAVVDEDTANLAMSVVNNAATLRVRDEQITTINYSCSSVTTPCKGATIEMTLPGPITPAGLKLSEQGYTVAPVTGDSVADTTVSVETPGDGSRVQRYLFTLNDPLPAGRSERIQVHWRYEGTDAPNNSTTTQSVVIRADNAQAVERSVTTTWTADTDIAIEKTGPTDPENYPMVGGEAVYRLRYGYQELEAEESNKVGLRWVGSAADDRVYGLGFVGVNNIEVVDSLPAKAVFVSATNGGVYDAVSHSVVWKYDQWDFQVPIESLVTVKFPDDVVAVGDSVTNTATITATVQNDPTATVTKTAQVDHGFAERKIGGFIDKIGYMTSYMHRDGQGPWLFSAHNSGNSVIHARWDDALPCTWSSQDAKNAGETCDRPAFVGPYDFSIITRSGYEEQGGWTLEYWTNKGNQATVSYSEDGKLTLPDGEWITRFTLDADIASGRTGMISFRAVVNADLPRVEPEDFEAHYNQALPPDTYYDHVASPDYVRIQNCAAGLLTDKDSGKVISRNDDICAWMRVHNGLPGLHLLKTVDTYSVSTISRPRFSIQASARSRAEGGAPTPFTVVDLLPEGFDADDVSVLAPEAHSTLKNPDGTPYDLSKVKVSIEKNYNGSGRTLIRWVVPDPVEGNLYLPVNVIVLRTTEPGEAKNEAMAFMPGDGAKSLEEDKSVRNQFYCDYLRVDDTFDVNQNGSTTDQVCYSSAGLRVLTTWGMAITKEVKGNNDPDFLLDGEIAQVDPGTDGAYRFWISNFGNVPLSKVVAYDILPYVGDVGVGPAANQARGSHWKPNLTSTDWVFQSVKEKPGRDPEITTVPASDITVQFSTVPNPCRGEVIVAGGSMNDGPVGCTPDAWGEAPADLTTITGFRIVMNRDIEVGEDISFVATVTSPVNANLIAWNSAAMAGSSAVEGVMSDLQPTEAAKVGINVSSDVEVTKSVARAKMNGDVPVRDANGVIETVESSEAIMPGDYMLYKVNLKAKGPAVASGMNVADALPEGVEYVSSETRICQDGATNPCTGPVYATATYDPATGTWAAMESGILDTNLNVGGTETLYVLVKVKEGTVGSTITNTATLGEFDQIDSNKDNNTASATFTVGGTLSGTIYNDADASWDFDAGADKPFEGVTVRLLDADGNPVKDASGADVTATTGADGTYRFDRLPLGSYKVEVTESNVEINGNSGNIFDLWQTYAYGSSVSRDQLGQATTVTPTAIELTSEAPNVDKVDFGFVLPAVVGEFVWFDANKDGIQDAEEAGVAGVTVTLTDTSGNPVRDLSGEIFAPVMTDANGQYVFENLLPGDYRLTFTVPSGYAATVTEAGDDRAVDSNGSVVNLSVAQGDIDDTVDLGLIAEGTIGDSLFWDVDKTGGSEPSGVDKPLVGVTVSLSYTTPAGVEKTVTTVTDENGKYSFKDLAPGDYAVTVDKASLATVCPECTAQTHAPSGDLSAVEGQELSLTSKVTLAPGAMTNNDQDWAFAVAAQVPPVDDPQAPAVDGGGSAAQPSASGNQTHVPSVNSGPSLARTGSDASVLGGMAAMAAIAGIAALAGKRRRDREDA